MQTVGFSGRRNKMDEPYRKREGPPPLKGGAHIAGPTISKTSHGWEKASEDHVGASNKGDDVNTRYNKRSGKPCF